MAPIPKGPGHQARPVLGPGGRRSTCNGDAERVRSAAPTEDELAARLADELVVSRNSLQAATEAYEKRRWSPGKLEPTADALWLASLGYLDVLQAIER